MFKPCMPAGERAELQVTWNHLLFCRPKKRRWVESVPALRFIQFHAKRHASENRGPQRALHHSCSDRPPYSCLYPSPRRQPVATAAMIKRYPEIIVESEHASFHWLGVPGSEAHHSGGQAHRQTGFLPDSISTPPLVNPGPIARLKKRHHRNFNANCSSLARPAPVICPNVALVMDAVGLLKFAWLKMLKNSVRSCRFVRSVTGTFLKTDMS
jgi:hypothetical protein